MALSRKDRVQETTTTTGTGTISLAGSPDAGFRTFVSAVTSLDTVRYLIISTDKSEWEVGQGVFTDGSPDTLSRVTVYSSSNAGALVNFSAGTKKVSLILSANDLDKVVEDSINAATAKTTLVDADLFALIDSAASSVLKSFSWSNMKTNILTYLRLGTTIIPQNSPRGFLINGKFTVTDSGSGIVVDLKTLAGTDATSTDVIYIRIGDTVRSITSALSVTLADGTSWMNSGSAELATKEIDYFLYAVWDSNSSAVGLTFSRIPFANLISDFSATTTNEKYCAGYSGFTTTDEVEVIGRFAATLSAGAGYTWSVPTFTASNLIQRPIYDSSRKLFLPSWTSSGTQPTIGNGVIYGDYTIQGHRVNGTIFLSIGSTTTNGTGTYSLQLPFKCNSDTSLHTVGFGSILDNGTIWHMSNAFLNTANGSVIGLTWNGNVGGNWSATTPMIPANGDTIRISFSYEI